MSNLDKLERRTDSLGIPSWLRCADSIFVHNTINEYRKDDYGDEADPTRQQLLYVVKTGLEKHCSTFAGIMNGRDQMDVEYHRSLLIMAECFVAKCVTLCSVPQDMVFASLDNCEILLVPSTSLPGDLLDDVASPKTFAVMRPVGSQVSLGINQSILGGLSQAPTARFAASRVKDDGIRPSHVEHVHFVADQQRPQQNISILTDLQRNGLLPKDPSVFTRSVFAKKIVFAIY